MSIVLPAHSSADNLRGIAAMLVSMAALIANDAFFKLAAAGLPTGQAIFLRGLFASLLVSALVVQSGALSALPGSATAR